jgi:hypothetical protein
MLRRLRLLRSTSTTCLWSIKDPWSWNWQGGVDPCLDRKKGSDTGVWIWYWFCQQESVASYVCILEGWTTRFIVHVVELVHEGREVEPAFLYYLIAIYTIRKPDWLIHSLIHSLELEPLPFLLLNSRYLIIQMTTTTRERWYLHGIYYIMVVFRHDLPVLLLVKGDEEPWHISMPGC